MMIHSKPLRLLFKISLLSLVSNALMATDFSNHPAFKNALSYLTLEQHKLGLTGTDLAKLRVKDLYTDQHNGVTHIYMRQTHNGLEVVGGELQVNVAEDGGIINVHNQFIPALSKIQPGKPKLSAIQAVEYAAKSLNLQLTAPLSVKSSLSANDQVLNNGGISQDDIPVKLVYQPSGDSVRLAWQAVLNLWDNEHWLDMRVDANTGEVLESINWVANADSYNVFPIPRVSPEDPASAPQSVVINPADALASPYGWHDTNGVSGGEFTNTRGNNVNACEDADHNNTCGSYGAGSVSGADLAFSYAWDPLLSPTGGNNQQAAIVNLFYGNNIIHDVLYQYGFTEAAGNFQANNYGRGLLGNDAVNADAQDGAGFNNANFATPPDGFAPRMQMYLWNRTSPNRDGDFENGVIFHEYGHGVSNRLTGGPANSSCLANQEEMGEGWSDWLALILTTKSTDSSTTARGIGPYLLGQANTGVGIRPTKYSTDMAVNPVTYNTIKTSAVPHGVGYVWATMLWEMQWALIGQYGFDSDIYHGTGGNNKAIQLVMDGMKLQPCSPGFVDGRNAILAADTADYAGANQCLIWQAFAKRGLGYSAIQGSSGSISDGVEAFDLHPLCIPSLRIENTTPVDSLKSGQILSYFLKVTNETAETKTNVTITDQINISNAVYVPNSATCSFSENNGQLTFALGNMAPSASTVCSFQVQVNQMAGAGGVIAFMDNMESGGANNWTVSHGSGTIDWSLVTTYANSPTHSRFAQNPATITDQYLRSPLIPLPANAELSFRHYFDLENTYDGGVVEISTDGTNWNDIGGSATKNGYTNPIDTNFSNPLAGRLAFTGTGGAGTMINTLIDLSAYAGQSVYLRFRVGTDDGVAATGWAIDDVQIQTRSLILNNQACVDDTEGDHMCSTSKVSVVGEEESLFIPIKAANGKRFLLPF